VGGFRREGFGYYEEQSTRPQTLGYGLADSPVGLLAWIYEKLVCWSGDYKWDDDEGLSVDSRLLSHVLTYLSILKFSHGYHYTTSLALAPQHPPASTTKLLTVPQEVK